MTTATAVTTTPRTLTLREQTRKYWDISSAVSGQGPPMTVGSAISELRNILEDLKLAPGAAALYSHVEALQQKLVLGETRNVG